MKYFIYNCLFIIIILFFAYINTKSQQEAFTPKMKALLKAKINKEIAGEDDLTNEENELDDVNEEEDELNIDEDDDIAAGFDLL